MFKPYNLRNVARARGAIAPPIVSDVNVEEYVARAAYAEDKRFEEGDMDDAEGVELSLRPPSPLTGYDSSSDSDSDSTPFQHAPQHNNLKGKAPLRPVSAEKARKRKHSNKQRQAKRIRLARETLHPAETYAAQPRVTENKIKEGRVYKILGDVSKLPTTSGGSWIGKRQQGIGEEPWELYTLLNDVNFKYIAWNGMWVSCCVVFQSFSSFSAK